MKKLELINMKVIVGDRSISSKELDEMKRCQAMMNRDEVGRKRFLAILAKHSSPGNNAATIICFTNLEEFDCFINDCRRVVGEL
ncbi:MAG: hypothetical protein IIT46_00535 [Lachnospiraceae bacterium]|nr:hypothetical protein [Lachnospiraceae bacterium]